MLKLGLLATLFALLAACSIGPGAADISTPWSFPNVAPPCGCTTARAFVPAEATPTEVVTFAGEAQSIAASLDGAVLVAADYATAERGDGSVWWLSFVPDSHRLRGATIAPAVAPYGSHPPLGVMADYAVFQFDSTGGLQRYFCERWHENDSPPGHIGVELTFDQAGKVVAH